jgi:hypothetical protein
MGRKLHPTFVVGISSTEPKTRDFVTEMTWAYQTKSAFSDIATLARSSRIALPGSGHWVPRLRGDNQSV